MVTKLTVKETEVLYWMSLGKSVAETADIIGIKYFTVKAYLGTIRRKLNSVNTAQCVRTAYIRGVFKLETLHGDS